MVSWKAIRASLPFTTDGSSITIWLQDRESVSVKANHERRDIHEQKQDVSDGPVFGGDA